MPAMKKDVCQVVQLQNCPREKARAYIVRLKGLNGGDRPESSKINFRVESV